MFSVVANTARLRHDYGYSLLYFICFHCLLFQTFRFYKRPCSPYYLSRWSTLNRGNYKVYRIQCHVSHPPIRLFPFLNSRSSSGTLKYSPIRASHFDTTLEQSLNVREKAVEWGAGWEKIQLQIEILDPFLSSIHLSSLGRLLAFLLWPFWFQYALWVPNSPRPLSSLKSYYFVHSFTWS